MMCLYGYWFVNVGLLQMYLKLDIQLIQNKFFKIKYHVKGPLYTREKLCIQARCFTSFINMDFQQVFELKMSGKKSIGG